MSSTEIDGIDYGPLAALVGVWKGDKGVDRAPEPEGEERNPYYETLTFEVAGDVTNAEEQTLAVVRYHQVVSRKSNDKVFHDQVGYWLWDGATDEVIQTLSIPRGVTLLAGGKAASGDGGEMVIEVSAEEGHASWGILQAPFMAHKARTTAFSHRITIDGDTLSYSETTVLDIYDKRSYDHTDLNTLQRV